MYVNAYIFMYLSCLSTKCTIPLMARTHTQYQRHHPEYQKEYDECLQHLKKRLIEQVRTTRTHTCAWTQTNIHMHTYLCLFPNSIMDFLVVICIHAWIHTYHAGRWHVAQLVATAFEWNVSWSTQIPCRCVRVCLCVWFYHTGVLT